MDTAAHRDLERPDRLASNLNNPSRFGEYEANLGKSVSLILFSRKIRTKISEGRKIRKEEKGDIGASGQRKMANDEKTPSYHSPLSVLRESR
jgi:hypothetical protein